jgi:putative sigma-54 modulation protein
MNVIITSKNFNASDHLKDTIEKKFVRLGKYFSDDIDAHITLTMEKERQNIEATITAKGTIFRAEETGTDMYIATDRIVDKLSTQISRFKTKLQKKHKEHKELMFNDIPEDNEYDHEEIRISKKKSFDIATMETEEAIMEMELIEHNFYLYLSPESGQVNVVYKRKDGKYGLLEPKY